MQIIPLKAEGIHHREVPGIITLSRTLPGHWYGYANLEAVTPGTGPREIDVVLVLDDRIVIADIKDWRGVVTSDHRRWYQDKRDKGSNPVDKIVNNARILASILTNYLQRSGVRGRAPLIDSCVIMTGSADFSRLPPSEKSRVFAIDDFCAMITSVECRNKTLTNVRLPSSDRTLTLKGGIWKGHFDRFFGPGKYFKPRHQVFGTYRAVSDIVYKHGDLYAEYDAQEVDTAETSGLLRYWDFSKSDPRFYSEEGRADIIGRERKVQNHLLELNQDMENALLHQKITDAEKGILYWEIFERRRQTQRLSRFMPGEGRKMQRNVRIDLVRILLAHVARMHALGVAHCDIGDHSVWIELPSTVRLSHLFAARIPEGKTIGETRYRFLARPVAFPETFIEQASSLFAKDVYLLGCIAHCLLLGCQPESTLGVPAEWNPAADANGAFASLHPWLAKALETEVEKRFPDAQAMLDAFNEATKPIQADANTLERLYRFRTHASVFQFWSAYSPVGTPLADNDRLMIYRTIRDGRPLIVKLWKRGNWVDERADGSRLLVFCQRAQDLADLEPDGICPIREVTFLSDHVAVVLDYVDAPSLQNLLDQPQGSSVPLQETGAIFDFLQRLIRVVDGLHAQGFAHGDIAPVNILCPPVPGATSADGTVTAGTGAVTPLLIDVVDLSGPGEGERFTPEYAPTEPSSAFERDRCGVLMIAENLLHRCDLKDNDLRVLASAFSLCRNKAPVFATLAPLAEALETIRYPAQNGLTLTIAEPQGMPDGFLLRPDAGEYHVGVWRAGREVALFVTGANGRLRIDLDHRGRPWRASVHPLLQDEIGRAQRRRLCGVAAMIRFERHAVFGPESVRPLLDLSEVAEALQPRRRRQEPVADAHSNEEEADLTLETEIDLDEEVDTAFQATPDASVATDAASGVRHLQDEIPSSVVLPKEHAVDVERLWRTLMDVELEDIIEAVVDEDALYSPSKKLVFARYRMRRGVLEFEADSQVTVQTLNRRSEWVHAGTLDVGATRRGVAAIEPPRNRSFDNSYQFTAGTLVRFESRRSAESRNRRERAINRILNGDGAIRNLVNHFTHRDTARPLMMRGTSLPDTEHLRKTYSLNDSQIEAFRILWTTGPVGLLQGPPGTGKTTFIAAFMHHALTEGGVRRILLASQSHEAVDNAAKGVIDLFRRSGETVSLVRVGHKNDLSDTVRPYHKDSIEQQYRQQFRARLKEKIIVMGKRLGLRNDFLDGFHFLTTTIRPILKQLNALSVERKSGENSESTAGGSQEWSCLEDTVFRLLANIGISPYEIAAVGYYALPQIFVGNDDLPDLDDVASEEADDEWCDVAQRDDDFPDDDEGGSELERQVLNLGASNAFDVLTNALAHKHPGVMPDQVRRLLAAVDLMDDWLGHVGSRHRNFEEFLVNTRQVVCGTCVGLGDLSLGIKTHFDLVIIDEAARCTAGELAVPMQSGKRVILVGDHKQLPPFHIGPYVAQTARRTALKRDEVRRSDFERAFTSPYGQGVGQTLRIQYRMLEPIGRLVSDIFYRDSPLEHGRSEPKIPLEAWPPSLSKALVWLDTAKAGRRAYEVERNKSRQNIMEVRAIIRLLRDLDKHEPFHAWLQENKTSDKPLEHPIGIICTYVAQVDLIRKDLLTANISPAMREAVRVDTVDSYQGKENLMVILSLVRNNGDGPAVGSGTMIKQGFVSQHYRINVALSRAMDRLVIVGTSSGWPPGSPMAATAAKVHDLEKEGIAVFQDAGDR